MLPVFNEAANLPEVLRTLHEQRDGDDPLDKSRYEVVLVDNNSTDDTVAVARAFAAAHPDLALHVIAEAEQGVSCARRAGMDFAAHAAGIGRTPTRASGSTSCRPTPTAASTRTG